MTKLVLGTAQFGLEYGITNSVGEISDKSLKEILNFAVSNGIQIFDTAADYGSSQLRLGKLSTVTAESCYVTKFSLPGDGAMPSQENIFGDSMNYLNVKNLYGVLFHKFSDLFDSRVSNTLEILRSARKEGVLSRIGLSIYNRTELMHALDIFPDLDLLQLPANVLDMDLLESKEVQLIRSKGVEVHVRSVFLQGLLLSSPTQLSKFFDPLKPALTKLNRVASETGKSVMELLLGNIQHHGGADAVIVGATTLQELEEITAAWKSASSFVEIELPPVPREILDPRFWPQKRMNR